MIRATAFLMFAAVYAQHGGGVSVQVKLERWSDARWTALDPRLVLHGGDEVRFRFRSNRPGYLYVINHDGQGRNTWLFPTPDTGEQNTIAANKEYIIPATAGVFQIAMTAGYETTYWILSPEELRSRKNLSPDVITTDQTPLLPRCGSGSLTARGSCTDESAGARRGPAVAIPKWFDNAAPLQPRDLSVNNEAQQSRISVAAAFDVPLIYEFRIAHQ